MSPKQIERAVRQAYKNTENPIKVKGDRLLMRGTSKGMEIEFWYNKVTQTIETAYPIGRG
ncbi:EndoU domain-containing protein [Streptomyces albogriseolus]|uniref:EndoU domain-containing protein n=1 Tax=Streptomyces albogriseolus TaxID=1887 RepID=UPI00338D9F9C